MGNGLESPIPETHRFQTTEINLSNPLERVFCLPRVSSGTDRYVLDLSGTVSRPTVGPQGCPNPEGVEVWTDRRSKVGRTWNVVLHSL